MSEWVKRGYGKGAIDRAGELLVPWWRGGTPPADLGASFMTVENWRTCHSFPLNTFQMSLRQRASRVESKALVAQRLKRFSSVTNKLVREPTMKLTQMQDLGGCRAILSSIDSVYEVCKRYCDESTHSRPEIDPKCYDYIQAPKGDGYRGIHLIGRYQARDPRHEAWNGQRIEIQLRTRLQHAFATAVETVTTFTRQPLKFGAGPQEWRRFFSLMGSALARREGTPQVDSTPIDNLALRDELKEAANSLKVRERLQGWTDVLQTLPSRNVKNFKWLLLVLNVAASTIQATGYKDREEAQRAIANLEKNKSQDMDAVLVWVPGARFLRAAYPNYYADTRQFLKALDVALS